MSDTSRKSFMVSFELESGKRNADYFRRSNPVDQCFHYGIPFEEDNRSWSRGVNKKGSFWAIVNTVNMSIFEVREAHINDSRKSAVLLTYDQLQSLAQRDGHGWAWYLPQLDLTPGDTVT